MLAVVPHTSTATEEEWRLIFCSALSVLRFSTYIDSDNKRNWQTIYIPYVIVLQLRQVAKSMKKFYNDIEMGKIDIKA